MTTYPLHTGDRVAEDPRLIAQLGVATATEVAPATLAGRPMAGARTTV
jgi:hypothetical protein